VHRLRQAMERRVVYPESWVWATEVGRQWFTRLMVATLYTFGLKRGPDLCETVLAHIDDLARPRYRHQAMALNT
jgi:hypothetical protein